MELSGTAIVADLGIKLLERHVPKGIVYFTKWLKGKKIVVAGNKGAGKSSFISYLRDGIIYEEGNIYGDFEAGTQEIKEHPIFTIKMGTKNSLELILKKTIDVPGNYNINQTANKVYEINPHGIIIFFDLSENINSFNWTSNFLDTYEDLWRNNNLQKQNILESIFIIMNKKDKVNDEFIVNQRDNIRDSLIAKLFHARGSLSKQKIKILPCISVYTEEKTKYMDNIITDLAREFRDS